MSVDMCAQKGSIDSVHYTGMGGRHTGRGRNRGIPVLRKGAIPWTYVLDMCLYARDPHWKKRPSHISV